MNNRHSFFSHFGLVIALFLLGTSHQGKAMHSIRTDISQNNHASLDEYLHILHTAIDANNAIDFTQSLIAAREHIAPVDFTQLINILRNKKITMHITAASCGYGDNVNTLMDLFCSPTTPRDQQLSFMYQKNTAQHTVLTAAVFNGDHRIIETILKKITPLLVTSVQRLAYLEESDINGDNPFILAARQGHLKTITVLLQYALEKLNPHDLVTLLEKKNNYGFTLFHMACRGQHQEIVTTLITALLQEKISPQDILMLLKITNMHGNNAFALSNAPLINLLKGFGFTAK